MVDKIHRPRLQVLILTVLAMVAFAANSIFCRIALGKDLIDPASFTSIRLLSGVLALSLLLQLQKSSPKAETAPNWVSAMSLFAYAALFSFAYVTLTTATGALILFAAVQATMIGFGIRQGDKLSRTAWSGLLIAVAGMVYLLMPGLSAPPLTGASMMVGAGIAWGIYSIKGKGVTNPLTASSQNFLYALPFTAVLTLIFIQQASFTLPGVVLAVASGAIASGVGYAIWYAALPGLKTSQASSVQLSVPVIATVGGIIFMQEPLTLRLGLASIAILGGIALIFRPEKPGTD